MLKVAALSFVAAAAIAAWPMKSTHAADVSSRTLKEIIHGEKRWVLYNSRRLSGECLPICDEPDDTLPPTGTPTLFEEGLTPPPTGNPTGTPTGSPTGAPTGTPTANPTGSPTANPTGSPTANPTGKPTANPTKKPTANPTGKPTANPTGKPAPPVNPGTFCHALNDRDECGLTGPGSCAVQPGPRSDEYPHGTPSCGIGVPVGYYPDLTRCDAYCYCTGTAAPSRYEIVNTGQHYDHHNDWSYLTGKWGKDGGNGAYGTEGGIPVHKDGMMSYEGTLRPPGTCGPPQKCDGPNDNKTHPYNGCKQFYQCQKGRAHQLQSCGAGTLYNGKICDHSYNVKCQDGGDSGSNPVPNPVAAPVSTPPPTTNEPKCNGKNDNSMHAWNGCKQFFQCQNGNAHKPQNCGSGLLFDDKAKVCNWPSAVNCKVP